MDTVKLNFVESIRNIDMLVNGLTEKMVELKEQYKELQQKKEIALKLSNIKNIDVNTVVAQGGSYRPYYLKVDKKVSPLHVSKYLVTQKLWFSIMETTPSHFIGEDLPVENISWIEALKFCNKLSIKEGLKPVYKIIDNKLSKIILDDGKEIDPCIADFSKTKGYRLPTEFEWEWFARGGNKGMEKGSFDSKFAGSDNIEDIAWSSSNSNLKTHNVGLKAPNELGLYDVSGNVWEWCFDSNYKHDRSSHDISSIEKNSFIYTDSEADRVIRGGSWFNRGEFMNLIHKYHFGTNDKDSSIGFRICRTY